jgi:hypothetical protein|tara:strand:+ start:431 stop:712 length:282 start_codon:yes stop_codon:yes gene_type:complete
MATYAVVKNGVVDNMIVWDGVREFSIPDSELIAATESARIGGSWDGNVFTFVEPPVPEPTAEQTADAENKANAKSKLAELGLSEDEISAAFGI